MLLKANDQHPWFDDLKYKQSVLMNNRQIVREFSWLSLTDNFWYHCFMMISRIFLFYFIILFFSR